MAPNSERVEPSKGDCALIINEPPSEASATHESIGVDGSQHRARHRKKEEKKKKEKKLKKAEQPARIRRGASCKKDEAAEGERERDR